MSIRLGLALCVLAGCQVQPTRPAAIDAAMPSNNEALDRFADGHGICLGVEYLPPPNAAAAPAALHWGEPQDRPSDHARSGSQLPKRLGAREANQRAIANRDGETTAIDDMAMQFLDDLMGDDRRRMRWEFGAPLLTAQNYDEQSPGIDLRSDEIAAEDQDLRLSQSGMQILRRPFQRMLRRTPLVSGLEVQIDRIANGRNEAEDAGESTEGTEYGRVSFLVRPNRLSDPVEIGYRRSGLRIATTQEQLKCTCTIPLGNGVFLELRARQTYADDSWQLRSDLRWQYSQTTNLHFAVGNGLDFLPSSPTYSLEGTPFDGSSGVLFYAVHLF
jgi:hypothetical protein